MHSAQLGDAAISAAETNPADRQPDTVDAVEHKGCLVYGIATAALVVAVIGVSAVIGSVVDVWAGRAPAGAVVLPCASMSWIVLHAVRIAVVFGFDGFDRLQGWLWAASYCVVFLAGPLALLLYGTDLWWTGRAPDRVGGIGSSLITGLLIGIVAGAAVTKRRSKDSIGRV